MKTSILIIVTLLLFAVASQSNGQNSYNDVAVIINTNSTLSDSIGKYFIGARNIPASNVIYISAPVTEEIDSLQFENLRNQVEQHLITNNLVESINYLVTTKGVPLKVFRGNTFSTSSGSSSVESELCLILGQYASYIGQAGKLISPYWQVKEDFTKKRFGFYLVTRLDGYTFIDIKKMIDNAVSVDSKVLSYGKFVFDADPTRSMVEGTLNGYMKSSALALQSRQHSVVFDSTTVFLTHLSNVLCYASWGSNDANAKTYTDNAKPYHTFLPGSIAETYVSTSARSFSPSTIYGQSLVADLISEGICGVKGYVYEPFSSAMANVQYVFPMYADGFTMAESFYSASLYLSWMDVIIGDPKTKIVRLTNPVSLTGRQLAATRDLRLTWRTENESIETQFTVERKGSNTKSTWDSVATVSSLGTTSTGHQYSFVDQQLRTGTYYLRLSQRTPAGRIRCTDSIEVQIVPANIASRDTTLSPLPVQLVSFNANVNGNSVKLTWGTATEINNYGFEIERRQVGGWTKVGFVSGAGTIFSPKNYSFQDRAVARGSFVYRLKQIDQDGMFEYSPEVSVTVGASAIARNEMRNYPNPFNPSTQISVSLESDDDVTLKVYDITGREVATLMHGIVSAGTHTVAFNAAQLPSGTYFAQLQTSTSVINKKMLLVK